jgi:hypothetical protein
MEKRNFARLDIHAKAFIHWGDKHMEVEVENISVEGHGIFPLQAGCGQSYLPPPWPKLFASLGHTGAKVFFHFLLGEPT